MKQTRKTTVKRADKQRSDVRVDRRDLTGLELRLVSGSRRKQSLSNRLEIRASDDRSDFGLRLTLRQARALRDFLTTSALGDE